MSPAELMLSRLEAVREKAPGRWSARCPAHGDKSPSLSLRELDDQRLLLHCFAGCSVDEVVAAVGMDVSDLFPRLAGDSHQVRRERRPFVMLDVLRLAIFEITVAYLHLDKALAALPAGFERVLIAVGRLHDVVDTLSSYER